MEFWKIFISNIRKYSVPLGMSQRDSVAEGLPGYIESVVKMK